MVTVRSNIPDVLAQHLDKAGWLANLRGHRSAEDCARIGHALSYLEAEQTPPEPILLAISVADTLDNLSADVDTLMAGLLHFHPSIEQASPADISTLFGATVAELIAGLREMSQVGAQSEGNDSLLKNHAEGLRKMLLAIVKDVRVILIKLAARLQCMRVLKHKSETVQKTIALETQEIFAPLANRLGIWQLKWELEDLAFRYLHPQTYKRIAKLIDEKRLEREDYIAQVLETLDTALQRVHIHAEVTGRPKHIYSIWRKMVRKGVDFDQIFDVRAVRVLVDKLEECYTVLGITHSHWKHIPGEFDDYIATPKENMYQSLHTAVVGPQGKTLEVQIRTFDMHQHSELGVASHWRYKEGGRYDDQYERRLAWMRQLLEAKDDLHDLIDRFKEEVSDDRVYVLTPQGRVVDLMREATVLDFAYVIHTDIGHRCKGAKVNGAIVPLTYVLNSGESVEILTSKQANPSKNWLIPHLGYLKTPKARSKLKTWFRQQNRQQHVADGKHTVDKEFQRLGIPHNTEQLVERFKFDREETFLAAVGRGEITVVQIASYLEELDNAAHQSRDIITPTKSTDALSGEVQILGIDNLLTQMAGCCKPVLGDDIIGYITRGRGVTIHRKNCQSITVLEGEEKARLVTVSWNMNPAATFAVDIFIRAEDRRGLLQDISHVLTVEHVNVVASQTSTQAKGQTADLNLTLAVKGISQLSVILDKISQLPSVLDVYRKS